MQLPIFVKYPCGITGIEQSNQELIKDWIGKINIQYFSDECQFIIDTKSWKSNKDDEKRLIDDITRNRYRNNMKFSQYKYESMQGHY